MTLIDAYMLPETQRILNDVIVSFCCVWCLSDRPLSSYRQLRAPYSFLTQSSN